MDVRRERALGCCFWVPGLTLFCSRRFSKFLICFDGFSQDFLEKLVGILSVAIYEEHFLRLTYRPDQVTPKEIISNLQGQGMSVEHSSYLEPLKLGVTKHPRLSRT